MNGGGLRADLPAGQLTFGQLFEAMPFDNRLSVIEVTGADLQGLFAGNLQGKGGILSLAGLRVVAECKERALEVQLWRGDKRVEPADKLKLVATDFMTSGGDGFLKREPVDSKALPILRDVLAAGLKKLKTVDGDAPTFYDPAHPRLRYPHKRPVSCGE
jgi:2',3'-cyclic-nucleotide 2'-phosphodiesterase (5'-nucleotidase family)